MNFNLRTSLYKIGFVVAAALATTTAFAQTDAKIGTNPGTKLPSAVLELESTTKGFLLPRMTAAQMNAITAPANGLAVYNTDAACTFIYNGSAWLSLCAGATNGLTKTGNTISLGGALTAPTTITTTGVNTLSIGGLQNGAGTDEIVTLDAGTGQLYRRTVSDVVGGAGIWIVGGNTLTATGTIGSNSNHDFGIETNGTTRLTFTSGGDITQNGTGQVTLNGNVDATSGLDVTGAPLTANAGSTLTGATNVNTTGAGATNIGNVGSTTTVVGATNINTTGASTTTLGNSSAAVNIAGTTGITGATNINTTGTAATTIGNAASTTTLIGNNLTISNLPAGTATDNVITQTAGGVLRTQSMADVIGNTLTVNNGLTKSTATNVQLGGTLMQNTSIAQATFDMNFSGGKVAIGAATAPNSTLQLTGSMSVSYRKVTADATLAITDYVVLANATGSAVILTLPAAASCAGRIYFVGKTDESVNTVTFSPVLRLTETTNITSINYAKKFKIVSDGTDWWIYNE